jgi:hypothetical protein
MEAMDAEVTKKMAQPQVIQGSWEEIVSHAEQLKGRTDLLLIVPDDGAERNGEPAPQNLLEAMKDYIGSADYGDANLSVNTGQKFSKLLSEKYRKGQE